MKHPGADVIENVITIDGEAICEVHELKLLGQHNWQNVCAAVTVVWQIDKNIEAIRSILTTFTGLPHRLELIREVDSVKYYNDSFASAPDATMAAITAVSEPKVVIIGGFERGLDLSEFAKTFADNQDSVRHVVCIGATGPRAAEALKQAGFNNYQVLDDKSLDVIVKKAQAAAKPGDAVLFSPGFASFDMFKNFEERGNLYRAAVQAL